MLLICVITVALLQLVPHLPLVFASVLPLTQLATLTPIHLLLTHAIMQLVGILLDFLFWPIRKSRFQEEICWDVCGGQLEEVYSSSGRTGGHHGDAGYSQTPRGLGSFSYTFSQQLGGCKKKSTNLAGDILISANLFGTMPDLANFFIGMIVSPSATGAT